MGPMGNYMTLLQLARGRGGYGGPQGYGMPRGPMGYGGYGGGQGYGGPQQPGWLQGLSASPGMQALRDKYAGMGPQGSSWEQPPPQGAMAGASYLGGGSPQQAAYGAMGTGAPQQGGAAPPGMGAHLSAEAKKQELMAQGMSEEQAHRAAMDTYSQMSAGAGPGVTQLTPESMGTAAAPQQAWNPGPHDPSAMFGGAAAQIPGMPGVYGGAAGAAAQDARFAQAGLPSPMQGAYPGMNTAYNAMGLRGRRRFY